MKKLYALYDFFKSKNMFDYSSLVEDLIKFADVSKKQQENRDFFASLFPNENKNKVFAFADQYYQNFKNSPDYQKNVSGLSFSQILDLLKSVQNVSKKDEKIKEVAGGDEGLLYFLESLKDSSVPVDMYKWVAKLFMADSSIEAEHLERAYELFLANKVKFNYDRELDSFNNLSDILKYIEIKRLENYENTIKQHADKYTDIIYESDKFKVVLAGSVNASRYWGCDTEWCTARSGSSNLFFNYSTDVFLYYVISKQADKNDSMSKFSVGYIKIDGKPKFIGDQSGGLSVDSVNRGLSLSTIESYLGNESDIVLDKIQEDVLRRDRTKTVEVSDSLSKEDFKEQLYMDGRDAISLEKLIGLYEEIKNPENKNVLKNIIRKQLKNSSNYRTYFSMHLDDKGDFSDLANDIAEQFAKEDPIDYFFFGGPSSKGKYNNQTKIAENILLQTDPYEYVSNGWHNFDELRSITKQIGTYLADKNPYHYFRHRFHKITGMGEISDLAIRNLIKNNGSDFFELGLDKDSKFSNYLHLFDREYYAEKSPFAYFKYNLYQSDSASNKVVAAKNLINEQPEAFFTLKLFFDSDLNALLDIAKNEFVKNINIDIATDYLLSNCHKYNEIIDVTKKVAEFILDNKPYWFFKLNLNRIPELEYLKDKASKYQANG